MEGRGYHRVRTIGKGSFAHAHLCHDKTGRQVVIKEINLNNMSHAEQQSSMNEVKVLSKLEHPNIVKYVDHFSNSSMIAIVMEYADGGDLGTMLKERLSPLSENETLHYFIQICLALKYVHEKKILHRDLKSQNVFLTHNRQMVKLGDFGISTSLKNSMVLAKTQCGTPFYFSPEMCQNAPYNSKSDIWSLGCLLYEMCTLEHPFQGKNMRELMHSICSGLYRPLPPTFSHELRGLVSQMLSLETSERPSVSEILQLDIIRDKMRSIVGGNSGPSRPIPEARGRSRPTADQPVPHQFQNHRAAPPPAPPAGPNGGTSHVPHTHGHAGAHLPGQPQPPSAWAPRMPAISTPIPAAPLHAQQNCFKAPDWAPRHHGGRAGGAPLWKQPAPTTHTPSNVNAGAFPSMGADKRPAHNGRTGQPQASSRHITSAQKSWQPWQNTPPPVKKEKEQGGQSPGTSLMNRYEKAIERQAAHPKKQPSRPEPTRPETAAAPSPPPALPCPQPACGSVTPEPQPQPQPQPAAPSQRQMEAVDPPQACAAPSSGEGSEVDLAAVVRATAIATASATAAAVAVATVNATARAQAVVSLPAQQLPSLSQAREWKVDLQEVPGTLSTATQSQARPSASPQEPQRQTCLGRHAAPSPTPDDPRLPGSALLLHTPPAPPMPRPAADARKEMDALVSEGTREVTAPPPPVDFSFDLDDSNTGNTTWVPVEQPPPPTDQAEQPPHQPEAGSQDKSAEGEFEMMIGELSVLLESPQRSRLIGEENPSSASPSEIDLDATIDEIVLEQAVECSLHSQAGGMGTPSPHAPLSFNSSAFSPCMSVGDEEVPELSPLALSNCSRDQDLSKSAEAGCASPSVGNPADYLPTALGLWSVMMTMAATAFSNPDIQLMVHSSGGAGLN